MVNLDYYCMKYGQKIGLEKENKETDIRKALGILQEDGIYAMFIWLEYKASEIRKKGLSQLFNEKIIKECLLSDTKIYDFSGKPNSFFSSLREIVNDYNKLLFMKKITMRTLTYALYHVKISEGE